MPLDRLVWGHVFLNCFFTSDYRGFPTDRPSSSFIRKTYPAQGLEATFDWKKKTKAPINLKLTGTGFWNIPRMKKASFSLIQSWSKGGSGYTGRTSAGRASWKSSDLWRAMPSPTPFKWRYPMHPGGSYV